MFSLWGISVQVLVRDAALVAAAAVVAARDAEKEAKRAEAKRN